MKKIKCLFKRDFETGLVYDEITEGLEWIFRGEGRPTVKYDGTCCRIKGGQLYRRYDRKLTKENQRRRHEGQIGWQPEDCKPSPDGWEPCEDKPDYHTGHWPGWLLVGDGPQDQYHREVFNDQLDGTYELVGPKIGTNPYGLDRHELWRHGQETVSNLDLTFEGIRDWLTDNHVEGIVFWGENGQRGKIRRKDFGLKW